MKIESSVRSRLKRSLAAFSLMEVTMGMGMIGMVAGAMLTGISSGFFTMKMARENQRATQIMLEKVETIRLYSWDQINTAGFIPASFTNTYDPQAAAGAQGVLYTGTLAITDTPIATSYSADMKQVKVLVSWKTGEIPRQREFTTYVARNGLQDYIY